MLSHCTLRFGKRCAQGNLHSHGWLLRSRERGAGRLHAYDHISVMRKLMLQSPRPDRKSNGKSYELIVGVYGSNEFTWSFTVGRKHAFCVKIDGYVLVLSDHLLSAFAGSRCVVNKLQSR